MTRVGTERIDETEAQAGIEGGKVARNQVEEGPDHGIEADADVTGIRLAVPDRVQERGLDGPMKSPVHPRRLQGQKLILKTSLIRRLM